MAGGIAGDSSINAQIAGVVGQNAVENNWLSAKEVNRLVELDRACSKGDGKACKGYLELRKLDRERDLRLLAACQQPSSTACRNLKAQANIANASLASGYFDSALHPELWGDKEKAAAHKKEYSDTDAVLRLSEGWTPEQIMREAALLNATRTVLADLTIVGTIKDFKEADTLADYATAIILAAPGLKQADTLKHAGDFTRAYKAAKEAGDLKAAKEIIELARTAEKSPNNLAKLAVKETEILNIANLNKKNIGFISGTASTALDGMRAGGGHAIRHLEGKVLPNTGSLQSRVEKFKDIAIPILEKPQHTANWRVGATEGKAFLGNAEGKKIVIVVAKEGPHQGKIISSFIPDENQLKLILSR